VRKQIIKKAVIAATVLSLVFSVQAITSAASLYKNPEEIFTQEELDKHFENARNQEVYADNKNTSAYSTSSTITLASTGTYPTRSGVILVTEDKLKGIIPTGHAAIIWTSSTVVEALSKGVTTGPNDWHTTRNSCYGVSVIGTTAAQDTAAANWSYKQIGKPYNFNYLDKNTRSKFYCSQLVYAAYLDNYGINLDTSSFLTAIHPIELVESTNTRTIYKK
jgi:uncharacterized protein YycO